MSNQKSSTAQSDLNRSFPGMRISGSPIPIGTPNRVREIAHSNPGIVENVPWMLRCNRNRLSSELAYAKENRFDRNNSEHREIFSQKIKESVESRDRAKELAEYREFELLTDVFALPFALGAFQGINLSAGELPLIITPRSRLLQEFTVRYIGQDGGSRQDQWRTAKSAEQIVMDFLSTDKVEFPIFDLQQGDINAFDDVNATLRFDMEMKIEKLAQDNLDDNQTASGLKDFLNIHSLIDSDNIPDTNYLDLTATSYGPANQWTIQRLKALLSHINRFGQGIDADTDLTLASLIQSPQNAEDWWDFVDLVSGYDSSTTMANRAADDPQNVVPTGVREEIFSTGMMNSAWGHNWTTQNNARLAKGKMYAFTNQPVGWFFTKTEYDQLIRWDGPDQQDQNYNQLVWKRPVKFYMPNLWLHRYVIIDF